MTRQTPTNLLVAMRAYMHVCITLLGVASTLSGCFTTRLISFEPPQHLEQLAESATLQIPLQITNDFVAESRGFQFLLGFLPVARVIPESLSQIVTAKMVAHAGYHNLGLLTSSTSGSSSSIQPRLRVHVNVDSVSINGYDLILTRRPSASVALNALLVSQTGTVRECHASGSFAEFSRFAFERDLEHALEQAVDSAARQVIECVLQGVSLTDAYSGTIL